MPYLNFKCFIDFLDFDIVPYLEMIDFGRRYIYEFSLIIDGPVHVKTQLLVRNINNIDEKQFVRHYFLFVLPITQEKRP